MKDERFPARLNVPIVDLLTDSAVVEHFEKQQRPVDAVPTPLPKWNNVCGDMGGRHGLARGWHITVGANTGHGKTLLGINMSAHAIQHGEKIGYINLEMSLEQMASRLYAIITGVPVRYLEPGKYFEIKETETARMRIQEVVGQTEGRFYTNGRPIYNVDQITGFMRYLLDEKGCRYFIIDYVQRVQSNYEDLFARITDVSLKVSDFCKAFNVITIALSQFNRETSKDFKSKPTSQGLMGGSPLENDSNQVVLLDHSRSKRIERPDPMTGYTVVHKETFLLIDKNRHGQQGEIPVIWDFGTLRINELTAP
jgi:replicative DNA helicase